MHSVIMVLLAEFHSGLNILNDTDNDECENRRTHNCHSSATCTNTLGSFSCNCDVGLVGDGVICQGKLSRCLLCVDIGFIFM